MAKNSDTCLTGLMEIPLGSSRVGPTKRRDADLHHIAHQLDRARNAAVSAWLKWRWDHPDWTPPLRMGKDGKPALTRSGKTMHADGALYPRRVLADGTPCGEDDGTGFETYLYHAARRVSPDVAGTLVSSVVREVLSNLKTDVQHHHKGHKWRWQAILANDEALPTFRGRTIPVPCNSSALSFDGIIAGGGSKDVAEFAKSGAAVLFPAFSKESGRERTGIISLLPIQCLSPGNRGVVKKIVRGEFRFCDSRLVCKKDRWQLQLTYQRPGENLGLDKNNPATLWPQFPDAGRPFFIEANGPRWQCGNGAWLVAEDQRYDAKRRHIESKYKDAMPGVKGHGKKRVLARLRVDSPRRRNIQRHFTWKLIDDVVRFCKRFNCGKVVYRRPKVGTREHLWLAEKGVQYNWTALETDLTHKLRYYGIECEIVEVNGTELRERFSAGGKPVDARKPQGEGGGKDTAGDGKGGPKKRRRIG